MKDGDACRLAQGCSQKELCINNVSIKQSKYIQLCLKLHYFDVNIFSAIKITT